MRAPNKATAVLFQQVILRHRDTHSSALGAGPYLLLDPRGLTGQRGHSKHTTEVCGQDGQDGQDVRTYL